MAFSKLLITLLLVSAFTHSHASMVWQPLPKQSAPQGGHAGHSNNQPAPQGQAPRRGGKPFQLLEGEGAQTALWAPNLAQSAIALEEGKARISSRGVGNYHALVAVRQQGNTIEAALRYVYMNGKPSGESPSTLTHAHKLDLEIVPEPLPREHWRYQSQNEARFVIHWRDAPLPNHEVQLTTANGSQLSAHSDAQGKVTFTLPDDFASINPGRRNNKPAEFVLTTNHQQGESHYQTTLSAAYHVNPSHWQSNQLALLMVAGGFIGGLGLVRLIPRTSKGKKA